MSLLCVRRLKSLVLVALAALFICVGFARAQDAGVDGGTANAADAGEASATSSTDELTAGVRALIAGTLPVAVDPASLFDISLNDEAAVQIDRFRLSTLLHTIGDADAGAPRRVSAKSPSRVTREQPDAGSVDPVLWHTREELDRARLAFYSLPLGARQVLLRAQAARVEAAKPKETDEEKAARQAAAEREKALDAARTARSEAERVVSGELARLIDLGRSLTALSDRFNAQRVTISARHDVLLGWQRRVTDAKVPDSAAADDTYDALRGALKASRDSLDNALDDLSSSGSDVPGIGANPLTDIPVSAQTTAVKKRRSALEKTIDDTRAEELTLRQARAAALLNEIDALNRDRLGLLPFLSGEKRTAITGFTPAGFDQSRSEVRQLFLILRYHRNVAARWIVDLRNRKAIKGASTWSIAAVVVPWLLVIVGFVWLRRRSPEWLALTEQRLAESDRREQRARPSPVLRALHFVAGFHRTLEWLILFELFTWMAPASVADLLEFQLLSAILGWSLVGALVVNVINAIATITDSKDERSSTGETARLRLRSLRLVGRVIVVFALVLLVSARLVGKGTIYEWVASTCWFAAVPVFLILVRWWRNIVFERVERVRRKSRLQEWVLANRGGWKSFFAAMVAAVQLFGFGAYKTLRNWITSFNLARRAHAYLFKRELARLAGDKLAAEVTPLNSQAFSSLAPSRHGDAWVPCAAEAQVERLMARSGEGHGGVIAIVGDRGMGKSTILRRIESRAQGVVTIDCLQSQPNELIRSHVPVAGSAADGAASAVLLDDAQALIKPLRGGLGPFDEALEYARTHAEFTLWVFAIDAVLWPLLSRARDARPLFDEVLMLRSWTDEQIGALLSARSTEAEITPTFEDLLEKLPAAADEIDKQEALAARRTGYFRMVWDHARGNPGLALQAWRASLFEGPDSGVRVRSLVAPDADELELLPDASLFVLRAILQMDPANIADLAKATRVPELIVRNGITVGLHHGYLVEERGGVRVAWPWLRSVVVLLERRHLLVNS
ncbi:MAG: ATP-binding protein [Polyangiaceae bacterium]